MFFLKIHAFLARLSMLPARDKLTTLIRALSITVAVALVIDGIVAVTILKKALSVDVIPYVRAANCLILISIWIVCVSSKTKYLIQPESAQNARRRLT